MPQVAVPQIAGEFVTNEALLASLVGKAPPGRQGKNVQVVLSTEVIDGQAGPATIVATNYW